MSSSSSSVVATLEPIHHDSEELRDGFARRHVLSIRRDSPIILGRNLMTGIHFSGIARNAATIKWKDNHVWLERHSSHCSVIQKNGSVVPLSGPLSHGDIVRLYKQEYAYRVKLSSSDDTTGHDDVNFAVLKESSEECMCAICFEIIVESTAVVPCGHVYCRDCLQGVKECPNCRLHIQSKLPIKSMDHVIHKLVLSKTVFSPPDVQHYLQRVQPTTTIRQETVTAVCTLVCVTLLIVCFPIILDVNSHVAPLDCFSCPFQSPPKRARTTVSVVSVDLTVPQVGDTEEDAIYID